MRVEEVESDVVVVGGGLAGVCAAIAAARRGLKVALIQNRSVLGGNSSSEVRVWIVGATAHGAQHFARETGIMGELYLENQYRNQEVNPFYWDLVLLEAVRAEPTLSLFLNTDVRQVEASGPEHMRTIESVTGWVMGSEREIRFTGSTYIDCSGDGLVGFLAGAEYRMGRESRAEYGESWAPEVPDGNTLGSSIVFSSKDVGHPVRYIPPTFAVDITKTTIPERRAIKADDNGGAFWWVELGGDRDVVHDNEEIRDELQGVVYGIWDYIKNSGKFEADNLTLEWIGSVPGKREYRRFVGDYTITQHDVLDQVLFEDRIGFGGWSIDLHPAGGVYATERGSLHWHPDGNYHIPLRSLYSRNVTNMWMAGRNISASHVAFGTTRVMATCGVVGEAAGTAAALALQLDVGPQELAKHHIADLHHTMVRSDASLLGVANTDPDDLALAASVSASSTTRYFAIEESTGTLALDDSVGMVIPVNPLIAVLEVLVDASCDTELVVDVHSTGKPQNYVPIDLVKTVTVPVKQGEVQWVALPVDWHPDHPQNAFISLRANPDIRLHRSEQAEPGTLFFRHNEPGVDEANSVQWRPWKTMLHRASLCLRNTSPTEAVSPQKVIGGYARPYGGPQMWVSDARDVDPAPWVELAWHTAITIAEVALVFDDEVDENLINWRRPYSPFDIMPSLVRDYRVQARIGDAWVDVAAVSGNRKRHRVHTLEAAVETRQLRVVVDATNGASRAHIVSVRVYGRAGKPGRSLHEIGTAHQ